MLRVRPFLICRNLRTDDCVVYRAAGIASGCQASIKELKPGCHDLRQNKALGVHLVIEIINIGR